jgi:transposase, IS5 family
VHCQRQVHKRYEFGVKVGITVINKSNFVLGARSFPGNPYDGHPFYLEFSSTKVTSTVSLYSIELHFLVAH